MRKADRHRRQGAENGARIGADLQAPARKPSATADEMPSIHSLSVVNNPTSVIETICPISQSKRSLNQERFLKQSRGMSPGAGLARARASASQRHPPPPLSPPRLSQNG
jgi:hypothetical protein